MIGVWFFILSVEWIVWLIISELGMDHSPGATVEESFVTIAKNLAIGVYCLLGAPHLVGMAYGHHLARETAPDSDATDDSE